MRAARGQATSTTPASSWVRTSRRTACLVAQVPAALAAQVGEEEAGRRRPRPRRRRRPGAGARGRAARPGTPATSSVDDRDRVLELVQEQLGLGAEDPLEQQVLLDGLVARTPGRATSLASRSGSGSTASARSVEEAADLPGDRLGDELVATALEPAVDGGPRQAGLGGDVLEAGLGQAPPLDAGDRRLEDPGAGVARPAGSRRVVEPRRVRRPRSHVGRAASSSTTMRLRATRRSSSGYTISGQRGEDDPLAGVVEVRAVVERSAAAPARGRCPCWAGDDVARFTYNGIERVRHLALPAVQVDPRQQVQVALGRVVGTAGAVLGRVEHAGDRDRPARRRGTAAADRSRPRSRAARTRG